MVSGMRSCRFEKLSIATDFAVRSEAERAFVNAIAACIHTSARLFGV